MFLIPSSFPITIIILIFSFMILFWFNITSIGVIFNIVFWFILIFLIPSSFPITIIILIVSVIIIISYVFHFFLDFSSCFRQYNFHIISHIFEEDIFNLSWNCK